MASGTSRCVYLSNLPEPRSVKIDILADTVRSVCGEFGSVTDVRVSNHIRQRGQAWVTFDSSDAARKCIQKLPGMDIFATGKKVKVEYARQPSDVALQSELSADQFAQHKATRLEQKEQRQQRWKREDAEAARRREEGLEEPAAAKKAVPAKTGNAVIPDEFLPPNRVLFVQNVPSSYDNDSLTTLFSQYAGFKEVRHVAIRRLAFVEFDNEQNSAVAKEQTGDMQLGGETIKVTFQRQ